MTARPLAYHAHRNTRWARQWFRPKAPARPIMPMDGIGEHLIEMNEKLKTRILDETTEDWQPNDWI